MPDLGIGEAITAALVSGGVGASTAGILGPALASTLAGSAIGGGVAGITGGNIGKGFLHGAEGGALTGGFNALGGLSGIGNTVGGVFGDPTLGSDIGNGISNIGSNVGSGLSNFTDETGLSSLWGGTAAPSGDLTDLYNGVNSGAPNLDATAGATSPVDFAPGGASASYAAGAAAPGSAGVGGGTLQGFGDASNIGESSAIGSANGGAVNGFDAGIGLNQTTGIPSVDAAFNSGQVPESMVGKSFDLSPVSNGADFGAAGGQSLIPTGSAGQPLYSSLPSTAGASMSPSGLSSLFSGQSGSAANGLLRGGLGYLLNNNNASGMNAITGAANQAQANFQPYMAAGTGAENTLANLYGNNGTEAQTAAQQGFQNSPGYQFALQQGLNAINADAAAKGQTLSGNTMEGINNYAQGTASQQYNNYINQLQNLASGGLTAAGGAGTAGLTGAGAKAQIGQNNANNQNTAIGSGLSALFPGGGVDIMKLLGGNGGGQSGLLSALGF